MLDQTSEFPTVFNFLDRNPIKPFVCKQDNILAQSGYKIVKEESDGKLMTEFNEIYRRTISKKQDPASLLGLRLIEDPNRLDLAKPRTKLLEKNGEYYLELQMSSNLSIVVRAEPVNTIIKMGLFVEGFQIENIFLSGNNDQVLDMMSLRAGKKLDNILTFMEVDSGVSPERQYKENGQVYPANVVLSFPTNKDNNLSWDEESFKYLFLHENSHAFIIDYQQEKTSDQFKVMIENEVEANAIALKIGDFVNKKFPNNFFNNNSQRNWVKKQINEGYGSFLKYRKQK